jgi:hypothetical protein
MKTITLSTKLISSFLAVAVITAAVGLVGVSGLRRIASDLERTTEKIKHRRAFLAEAVNDARSAQVSFKTQVQEWKNILLRGQDAAAFDKYWKGFVKEETETGANLAALKQLMQKEGLSVTNVEAAGQALTELGLKYRDALTHYQGTNHQSAQVVDKLVRGMDRPPTEAIDNIVKMANAFEAENTTGDQARLDRDKARVQGFTLAMVGAGVGAAVFLGLYLSITLSRQIRRVVQQLETGAAEVASASGHISAASQTLAEGASEQAASLEETGASLEEMSSMTKRNAENAQQATGLAAQARTAAEGGSRDMAAMSQSMQAIKSSSDDIAKIIKTIDEIAFQTNILALNAAVEAARAGEAGMGFAVVADEVRNLAQRSAQAAKETAEKIESAIAKTAQGVAINQKVAASLTEIVDKTRQVDTLAAEVASASREQSQGIAQVNIAVTQMDKVTQSNAATAEESASAAEELNAQAATLNEAVRALSQLVGGKVRPASPRPGAGPATVDEPSRHHTNSRTHRRPAGTPEGANANSQSTTAGPHGPQLPHQGGDFKDF